MILASCVVASPTPWPQRSRASILIMKVPYTKSGKCGQTVWQRNRYGQISYPAFVPFNPRTPSQMAVRQIFRAVSARWRTLTQSQRDVWIAVASTMKSKPRLSQCGVLPGFNLFIKVNVPLANQGKPQVDLPAESLRSPKPAVSSLPVASVANVSNSRCPSAPGDRTLRRVDKAGRAGGFASKRETGRRGTPLRYRSSTILPPYHHRSNTLAGRWGRFCPQDRLRFPCRSQPPRCRGAPAPHLTPVTSLSRSPPSS
jgi:hypothetical protein